ncbi:MAG TPA: ABC transporter substrate-binding protein [Xanthobacteraceae bacterium]|jgi:NitT/TauT family transport system substrate-binding protein
MAGRASHIRPTRRRFAQIGAAAALVGISRRALPAPLGPIEKPRLTLGIPLDAASFTPVYVAAARTWKPQGLAIELISFRGDAEVAQALAGDSIDISLQSFDGLINLINAGQPVRGFYAGFHQSDFAWFAQPKIKQWQDLKGGTAGVSTYGSLTDQLTRTMLRRNGLAPEKDVAIVQAGTTASMLQALKAGRLALAILSPPFKWMAQEAGFTQLGTQMEIAPLWPKHAFLAKTKFIDGNPNTLRAFLRAHVAALRLARAQPALTIGILVERLKWSRAYAERAYEETMPAYDERGSLPDAHMDVFWSIEIAGGTVTEAWPDGRLMDERFIRSFDDWMM